MMICLVLVHNDEEFDTYWWMFLNEVARKNIWTFRYTLKSFSFLYFNISW